MPRIWEQWPINLLTMTEQTTGTNLPATTGGSQLDHPVDEDGSSSVRLCVSQRTGAILAAAGPCGDCFAGPFTFASPTGTRVDGVWEENSAETWPA